MARARSHIGFIRPERLPEPKNQSARRWISLIDINPTTRSVGFFSPDKPTDMITASQARTFVLRCEGRGSRLVRLRCLKHRTPGDVSQLVEKPNQTCRNPKLVSYAHLERTVTKKRRSHSKSAEPMSNAFTCSVFWMSRNYWPIFKSSACPVALAMVTISVRA